VDPDEGAASADPCPLCEGDGTARLTAEERRQPADGPALGRLLTLLASLSQAERQRLYEELHARYDCRIYRR
jgi:hypothetical protein